MLKYCPSTFKYHKIANLHTNKLHFLWTIFIIMLLTTVLENFMPHAVAAPLRVQRRFSYHFPVRENDTGETYEDANDPPTDNYNNLKYTSERSNIEAASNTDRHKRYASFGQERFVKYMEKQTISWYNPCNGSSENGAAFTPSTLTENQQLRKFVRELNKLKQLVVSCCKDWLLRKKTTSPIYIRNMAQWDHLRNSTYKFLPTFSNTTVIHFANLRKWHRQMQKYVASFQYLHLVQYRYDMLQTMQESSTSKELKELHVSAHAILCQIEIAINTTRPLLKLRISKKTDMDMAKLTIKPQFMENKILKFKTPLQYSSLTKWRRYESDTSVSYDTMDLDLDFKFAKSQYIKYLRELSKNLRQYTISKRNYLNEKKRKHQRLMRRKQHKMQIS